MVINPSEFLDVAIQRRSGRHKHEWDVPKASEEASGVGVALIPGVANCVLKVTLASLKVGQEVRRSIAEVLCQLYPEKFCKRSVLANSGRPLDPEKSIGFLTVSQGPFVE